MNASAIEVELVELVELVWSVEFDARALVTSSRLSEPSPSASALEMIELAAFCAGSFDWAESRAESVLVANWLEAPPGGAGGGGGGDADVAALFAELDGSSVENCPVRLARSLCSVASICCRVDAETLEVPEVCMVNTFIVDRLGHHDFAGRSRSGECPQAGVARTVL